MRAARTLATAVGISCLLAPAPASAEWSLPRIASVNGAIQGQAHTESVAVSGDGRYVVFSSRARELVPQPPPRPGTVRLGGIFRRDAQTGLVALVAPGRVVDADDGSVRAAGAEAPSVSGDGRYVLFSSDERLLPEAADGVANTYRRDMTRPLGAPGAVVLVSAHDGADAQLGANAPPGLVGRALSADGQRAVLVPRGAVALRPGGPEVPAGTVLVRDIPGRRTEVASVARDPATGRMTDRAVGGGISAPPRFDGNAVISADGTTVAWVGRGAAEQTRSLPFESALNGRTELLWRRVADGPGAPTRRIAGRGADPDDPACDGQQGTPACAGSFVVAQDTSWDLGARLALSADGRLVAFTSQLQPTAQSDGSQPIFDAFLADMRAGLTRKAAVREITRDGGATETGQDVSAVVLDVALSDGGTRLAFTTQRVRFRLPQPVLVAPPAPFRGIETYVVDLPTDTMQRISRSHRGGKAAGGDASQSGAAPALSADGHLLAFISDFTDLVFGDLNDARDAFYVEDVNPPGAEAAGRPLDIVRARAPDALPLPAYRLRATVTSRRDGTVSVNALVPGAGAVSTRTRARVPRTSRRGERRTRARTLRRVSARARASGLVRLVVRPDKRTRRFARRRAGVLAKVTVTYRPSGRPFAGRPALRRTLDARFRVRPRRPSPTRHARTPASP